MACLLKSRAGFVPAEGETAPKCGPPLLDGSQRMPDGGGGMTEAEARAALRAFVGIGNVEPWIAGRPWRAAPSGWTVAGELQGWRFRVEVARGGVRVVASTGRGEPAVWFV